MSGYAWGAGTVLGLVVLVLIGRIVIDSVADAATGRHFWMRKAIAYYEQVGDLTRRCDALSDALRRQSARLTQTRRERNKAIEVAYRAIENFTNRSKQCGEAEARAILAELLLAKAEHARANDPTAVPAVILADPDAIWREGLTPPKRYTPIEPTEPEGDQG